MTNLNPHPLYRCGDGTPFANPLGASPAIAKLAAAGYSLPLYQTDDYGKTWRQVGEWHSSKEGWWATFPEMWEVENEA
ncbi:MAG: hypothetical protein AAFX78_10075 [Cyanobacteria bacterium J06638_20]